MPLLREADRAPGLTRRLAGCFADGRSQERVEHSVRRPVVGVPTSDAAIPQPANARRRASGAGRSPSFLRGSPRMGYSSFVRSRILETDHG